MSAVISTSSPAIDLAAVKTRQQAAWSTGNYAVVGTTLQIVGENLCESARLARGRARARTSPPATAMPRLPRRAAGAT